MSLWYYVSPDIEREGKKQQSFLSLLPAELKQHLTLLTVAPPPTLYMVREMWHQKDALLYEGKDFPVWANKDGYRAAFTRGIDQKPLRHFRWKMMDFRVVAKNWDGSKFESYVKQKEGWTMPVVKWNRFVCPLCLGLATFGIFHKCDSASLKHLLSCPEYQRLQWVDLSRHLLQRISLNNSNA